MKKIMAFLKEEDGLELTEYAVIGALIVLGTVATITLLGESITNAFTAIIAEVDKRPTTGG